MNMTAFVRDSKLSADTYEVIGDNIVLSGNVTVISRNQRVSADKIVVNSKNEDFEAIGNVKFNTRVIRTATVTLDKYLEASTDPLLDIKVKRYVVDIMGEQGVEVEVVQDGSIIMAERAAGSFASSVVQFYNFAMKTGTIYLVGERCERAFDGTLSVYKTRFTTCEYLTDNHDHYALSAYKATLTPREAGRSAFNYTGGLGDHSIVMLAPFLELYEFPVFFFPILYKPSDFASFGGKLEIGNTSDWGMYFRTAKHFTLMKEPYWNINLMFDFYGQRGPAFGISSDFLTPESSTEFYFWNIFDRNPFQYWNREVNPGDSEYRYNNSRLDIPRYRYEIRLNNLTHLTRRLDFRAQLDKISDYQLLRDFDNWRFSSEYHPPSYVSLEYQHERFTASLMASFRLNDFTTTVNRLPEIRVDLPRQQLIGNLYYQGETSLAPMWMQWRHFQRDIPGDENWRLRNYNALRFDMLHFLYYPINFFNINIIPRAGIRLTGYSKSSRRGLDDDDLANLFLADVTDGIPSRSLKVKNYDSKGGAKFRVIGEFGVEANTKIYGSWQNVKSPLLQMDGLRHVIVPYINYTMLPPPTIDTDNLYYFDEIDRIREQHYVRFGMVNRLQTRHGSSIYEWMSLETYWDLFIQDSSDLNQFGDIGIILKMHPFKGVTLTTEMLLDIGGNGGHQRTARRGNKDVGRPGMSGSFFNRLTQELSYEITPEWRLRLFYRYVDGYFQRYPYSMGSSLETVATASVMYSYINSRTQTIGGGIDFPIFFDRDMHGTINVAYDIETNLFHSAYCRLTKRFHCFYAAAEFGFSQAWDRSRSGKYHKHMKHYLSFEFGLTAIPSLSYSPGFSN